MYAGPRDPGAGVSDALRLEEAPALLLAEPQELRLWSRFTRQAIPANVRIGFDRADERVS